jgi:hypothetical protein
MVSGRGADLDRDAESAIHGRTQGVTSLLRRFAHGIRASLFLAR